MTSFIAAESGQTILGKKNEAKALGITIASYAVNDIAQPSKTEFNNFLAEFTTFCKTNKDKNCDSLLFTGGHGESNNTLFQKPFFNNLRKAQIDKIIKAAKDNNVTFNHIIADCCCAPYGLNKLKGLLANGGELIGDRTTSTSHWNHSYIIEPQL